MNDYEIASRKVIELINSVDAIDVIDPDLEHFKDEALQNLSCLQQDLESRA